MSLFGGAKYGNHRTASGYDSKREERRAWELQMMERAGEISALREQVKYELVPAQYEVVNGRRVCVEKSVSYVADFQYVDARGNVVVEDTKGCRTKEYIIKRKLMLYVHRIRVVEK